MAHNERNADMPGLLKSRGFGSRVFLNNIITAPIIIQEHAFSLCGALGGSMTRMLNKCSVHFTFRSADQMAKLKFSIGTLKR